MSRIAVRKRLPTHMRVDRRAILTKWGEIGFKNGSARMRAEAVGGMSFCGGTLHPQMRGLANPQRLTAGDGEPVREKSRELAKKSFAYAEQRLASKGWWLGELSIVDVYLAWAFSIARKFEFDISAYPILGELEGRLMDESEAHRNMQDEERRSSEKLGL
jgi:glutathione S-transferase